jgi:hypothetical protein
MLLPLLTLGWTLAATPTPAERSYAPCPASSPNWAEARKRFEALDARVAALPDDGDTREAMAAFQALLDSRCFEMSREEGGRPREELPALALKDWWKEGGRAWVESYLELGKPGVRKVVIPPEPRKVLALETVPPSHRLSALLCPAADAVCAQETAAWYSRAETAFLPENQRRPSLRDSDEPDPLQKCEARARKKPKRWRYTNWRQCVDQGTLDGKVLPIARLQAPKEGWLVLRGRRGHYSFCDEVRTYHLATGTAYISQSCSGLALTEGGGVDGKKTDAARQSRVRAGTMELAKLREVTWMLLLGAEVQSLFRPRVKVLTVPEDFRVEWRERVEGGTVEGGLGGSMWFTTAQTQLQWTWFPPGKAEPLSGKLTWPNSSHPQEDHADVLIAEAEKTFTEGCPSSPPPLDTLDFSGAPSVSGLDAPGGVTRTQDALIEALRAWRPPPACASGKPAVPGTP